MSNKGRLLLDLALFAGFLVVANPESSGLAVHEWLGLALAVPTLVHLVVNWEWTSRVARRFVEKLLAVSRLNLVIDAVLFVAAVTASLSGVMVSRLALASLGLVASSNAVWHGVHYWSSYASIGLLVAHLTLHARWIVRAARGTLAVASPARRTATVVSPARGSALVTIDRKELTWPAL